MDKQNLPNIFEYLDFKKYLDDYRRERKKFDPGFTHTYICYRLRQKNAKSYFNNVVKGRKNVTGTFIDLLIDLLELQSDEAKFFRALVNYNQANSPPEKEFYFDQLIQLNQTPHTLIEPKAFEYFKEWYHAAIRAMLDIFDFIDNYKELAGKLHPPVTAKEVRESIVLLRELELIRVTEQGYLKPTDKMITTGEYAREALVKQYQLKCLEHAGQALIDERMKDSRFFTQTISVSTTGYHRIMERMQQFKKEIRSIVHKDEQNSDTVCQLSIQLFPQIRL